VTPPQSNPSPGQGDAGVSPKVLYVGGFGRSGSTLVGRVLGEAPSAVCVGETRYLCTRGILENVQCGCGQPFHSCAFWRAVGEEGFGGWDEVNTERLVEADSATIRLRALPLHQVPSLRSGFAAAIEEYTSWLTTLYAAIARVSGGKTIVETSKNPNFASLLTRMRNTDLRIIHLVRDSRAVAYSWTRNKPMPSPIGDQELMPRFNPGRTAMRWLTSNVAFPVLAAGRSPYIRLRYDDFVTDPRMALQKLSRFAGTSLCPPDSALTENSVKLGDHHIFSGNPMRASTGWVEMRIDDEWQTMLPSLQFANVTAITWPLLRLYGYPTIPPGRRTAAAGHVRDLRALE
jgi:Sulfotransferase family